MNKRVLENGIAVLEPKGYLTAADDESEELRRLVHELLHDGYRYLVIDCTQVNYVNNNGLDMFRDIEVAFVAHTGKVVFTQVEKRTKAAARMIGLTNVLDFFDTTDEGIGYLAREIKAAAEQS